MFDKKIIYFLTVVNEGSFSADGRKLLLSQSAISQHISSLENDLDIKLFDRSQYRPVLTEAGNYYYQGCLSLLKQYKALENELKDLYKQTIKIGFTGSYENKDILALIHSFKNNNPNINISFIEGSFEQCVNNLINDNIDVSFGLESDYKYRNDVSYSCLFSYNLCVICAYDHPLANFNEVSIKDIKNEDFILLSKAYGKGFYKDYMNSFKLDGFKPKIKKTVDSFDELVFYVSIGEGISIASDDVVRDSDVKKIKLVNSHHQSNYVIGYKNDKLNPLLQTFINESIKYFQTL